MRRLKDEDVKKTVSIDAVEMTAVIDETKTEILRAYCEKIGR